MSTQLRPCLAGMHSSPAGPGVGRRAVGRLWPAGRGRFSPCRRAADTRPASSQPRPRPWPPLRPPAPRLSRPGAWWNDAVFYEVFVRSFQDSDGDGIGDLQGPDRPAGLPQRRRPHHQRRPGRRPASG
ncbi:MAG: hypothetical protein V9H69_07545 [Anaerolineae bacterium]